jgi:hypothetical protein
MSFLATTEHIWPIKNISGDHRTLMPTHRTFSHQKLQISMISKTLLMFFLRSGMLKIFSMQPNKRNNAKV